MTELEQLRADLAVLRKFNGSDNPEWELSELIDVLETRLAKLESEANPWRDVKKVIHEWYELPPCREAAVAFYVRYLEFENTSKDARIAELKDQIRAEQEMVRTHFAEIKTIKSELAAKDAMIASLTTEKEEKVIDTFDGVVQDIKDDIANIDIVSRTTGFTYYAKYSSEKFTEKGIGSGDRFICNIIERGELTRIEIESI